MGFITTSIPMANELPALSFGIEIELLFAFSESHLQQYLQQKQPSAKIVKAFSQDAENGLRSKRYPKHPYHSWALLNTGENPATSQPSVETFDGPIRAYINEPLEMVSELLGNKINHQIHNTADHSKSFDYSKWIVTSDDSIIAPAGSKKAAALSKFTNNPDNWDTYGVELVSPPFTNLEDAQKQVSTLLALLRGSTNAQYGILVDDSCGLHVHVGQPSNAAFPIATLQHLAEIQAIYEEQISRLHPAYRRDQQDEIASNRQAFFVECPDPIERTVKDDEGNLVTKLFEPLFKSLDAVRAEIFDDVAAARDPYQKLVSIMGDRRAHIINWCHVNRSRGSRTVEFRQHAASIDETGIFWWVRFCLGLVRLAGRNADSRVRCPVENWDSRIEVEDLLAAVGLEEDGVEFYCQKIVEYDDGRELNVYFVEAVEDDLPCWE